MMEAGLKVEDTYVRKNREARHMAGPADGLLLGIEGTDVSLGGLGCQVPHGNKPRNFILDLLHLRRLWTCQYKLSSLPRAQKGEIPGHCPQAAPSPQ